MKFLQSFVHLFINMVLWLWSYIWKEHMIDRNCPLLKNVWMCITRTSFNVIVNGKIKNSFYPKRDFNQSDPMSPYLFYYFCCIFGKIYSYVSTGSLWSILKFQKIAQKSLTLCLLMIIRNFVVLKGYKKY